MDEINPAPYPASGTPHFAKERKGEIVKSKTFPSYLILVPNLISNTEARDESKTLSF
jgi:hypothetical protein